MNIFCFEICPFTFSQRKNWIYFILSWFAAMYGRYDLMAIPDLWWVQRQPVCERPDGCTGTGICLLCLSGQFFVLYLSAVWVLSRWRGNDQTALPVCCVGYWTVCAVGPEVCTYLSKCVDEQIAVPECCVDKQMAVCLLCWLTDGCLSSVLINRWLFVCCVD